MDIRKSENADLEKIEAIYNSSRPDEFYAERQSFSLTPWSEDDSIQSIIDKSEIYVSEIDVVIGFCGHLEKHIKWLFVSPEHRGKGVASHLLAFVLPIIGVGATLSVVQSNKRARNLYSKFGFTVKREFVVDYQSKDLAVCTLVWNGEVHALYS